MFTNVTVMVINFGPVTSIDHYFSTFCIVLSRRLQDHPDDRDKKDLVIGNSMMYR